MKIHLDEISGWVLSGTAIEALGNRVAQLASGQYTPDLDHVPTMGGYIASDTASGIGATVSASAEFSNFWRSWYAFRDGQPSLALGWIGGVADTGWLRSIFNVAVIVNKVTIQAINDGNYVRSPIDFTIRGSNDGFVADDNVLLTVTGEPAWSQNEKRTYTFPNYTEYAAYEIRITDSDGFEPGIGEMEMMFEFVTGSPVAEGPLQTFNGVFDDVTPLVVDEEITGAGNIKYQYDIDGAGYNGVWLTLAAANAALASLPVGTFQIKMQFNSDGIGKARLHNSPTYMQATIIPSPIPPASVISDYIMPLRAELVRDKIALIISAELPKQKAIAIDLAANQPATIQGIQAQKDLDDGIYDIINNIFVEKGTHFDNEQIPGMNILFGRADYSGSVGSAINEQLSDTNYSVSVHIEKKHEQKDDVMIKGDRLSAETTMRTLGILRGILMSGQYLTLDLQGIVEGRRVTSLDVFQPDYQEENGRHGIVGVLGVSVKFTEFGPELSGEALAEIFTDITLKLRTADDGKVISINV